MCVSTSSLLTNMTQIKYRAACDHCSTTKTKCTQERPHCARCRTLGRECHYSRSLRAGKPPRTSKGLNRRLSSAPVLPRHSLSIDPIAPVSYPTPPAILPSNDTFQFSGIPVVDESSSSRSSSGLDWNFDFNNSHDYAQPMEPARRKSSNDLSPTDISFDLRRPSDPQTTAFNQFEDLIGMSPPPAIAAAMDSTTVGLDGDQCAKLATETLSSLYSMPPALIDVAGTRRPSVDQALTSTARAVQIVQELLQCPCTKDFNLPIIIALLVSKILAWYQAVVFVHDPYTTDCAKEFVVETPLVHGQYQLDDRDGWALKNRIVLGQLRRLDEAVSRYHALFCYVGGSSAVAVGLYASIGGFLKSRLQNTIEEIESRLSARGR